MFGRLEDVPFDVHVLISRRHYRDRHPKYFARTDLSLGSALPLQWYAKRWGCETDNLYVQTRLGIGDFRVQSYETTDKWCATVHLTWAYVQWWLATKGDARLRTPADAFGDIGVSTPGFGWRELVGTQWPPVTFKQLYIAACVRID
jgi:hypothetical protein